VGEKTKGAEQKRPNKNIPRKHTTQHKEVTGKKEQKATTSPSKNENKQKYKRTKEDRIAANKFALENSTWGSLDNQESNLK